VIGWKLLELFLLRRLPTEAILKPILMPIVDLISLDCAGEVVSGSELSANNIRANMDVADRVKDSFEDENDAILGYELHRLGLLPIILDGPQPDLSSLARALASYDGSRLIFDVLSVSQVRFRKKKLEMNC
ncbi:hypothetical protein TorRG33x02_151580, partial [Trema orientale]